MARKRNRSRKATVKQVRNIVNDELNKTRETNKLVSYVGWSRLNDILTTNYPSGVNIPNPAEAICCYSLTGGLASTIDATQDPNDYIAKNLFVLLPSDASTGALGTGLSGVSQAQQGGTANQTDASAGTGAVVSAEAIANVHQLEGRSCYLKKFYATVALNNGGASVDDPTNLMVRAMVIETRRPLSSSQLSKQILLQNHGTLNMSPGSTTLTNYPCSALGYLNRDVIKKVHFDKVFTLNGGGGATGSLKRFKLKIPINKKARWSYYYPSGVPDVRNQKLTYQGPYLYYVMWAAGASTYQQPYTAPAVGNAGGGIGILRRPAWSMSNILSFMDD